MIDTPAEIPAHIVEPLLIVVMSCVVGFIVLATLLPILRLSGSL